MPVKKPPVESALRMISQKRLSKMELITKMKKKGYSEKEIESAILYLTESHYLNDKELLSDYIKYLVEKKRYGPARIIGYLKRKGYESNEIKSELESLYSEDIFIKNATDLISKKMKNASLSEQKVKNKAIRILSYNGYDWDIIERIIRQ